MKPKKIHLHKQSKSLELIFGDQSYFLSAEFLRVHSPSAEVKGHGPGQEQLVFGKIDVGVGQLKPVGHYGLQIVFDDGHDSGIFSWSYLHHLCTEQESLWRDYLAKLKQAGKNRDPHTTVIQFSP